MGIAFPEGRAVIRLHCHPGQLVLQLGKRDMKGALWMIELREHRVFLLIGALNLLLAPPAAGIILLLALREHSVGGLLLAALLSPGIPLGLYLTWSALRLRIRFDADTVVFTPVFGRTRTFRYDGIAAAEVSQSRCWLLAGDGRTLASFRRNLLGAGPALELLRGRGIPFSDRPEPMPRDWGKTAQVRTRRSAEHTYIRARWSQAEITRERRRMDWLGWVLMGLSLLALAGSLRMQLAAWSGILLSSWALYLWRYPKMRFQRISRREDLPFYVECPYAACLFSLMLLAITCHTLYTPQAMYLRYALALGGLLAAPTAVVLAVRRARPARALCAVLSAVVLGAAISPAMQYLAVREPARHRPAAVEDMRTHTSRGQSSYSIRVTLDGESRYLRTTADVYRAAETCGQVTLCHQTSIFGYEIWRLHAPAGYLKLQS